MSKKRKEGDLSAKISSIINIAPDFAEEDDDFTKINQIQVDESGSDSGDELNLAEFRKINIELLDAEDKKYAGVQGSRTDFNHEKAFGSESDSDDELDTGSVASGDADNDAEDSRDDGSDEDNVSEEDEGEEEEDEDTFDAEDEDVSEDGSEDEEEDNEPFQNLGAKVTSDIEKGNAIRNQFSIWDSLLECRIKFQKCLAQANKLPHSGKMEQFKVAGGEDFSNVQKACQSSLKKVLKSFLDLQKVCLNVNTNQFEEVVNKRNLDDDEITSEDDSGDEAMKLPTPGFHKEIKRRRLGDLSEEIKDLHQTLIPFRNETIQKWNEKTRVTQLGSKDFSAFEQSTLQQIEMVLADKQRLLKRTRTKRSDYHVLGDDDEGPSSKVQRLNECPEIFDDDDFYHQLLRELLERRTTDVTDPVQLSRQWLELQKARSKMKRTVDQKASKGRKLRYNVHQKLVNFMMPIDNTTWTDEAKSELFASLFGKKAT